MTRDHSSNAFKSYLNDDSNFENEAQSILHNLRGTAARLMANVKKDEFDDIEFADIEELIDRHAKIAGVTMSHASRLSYKSRFNRAVHRFIQHQDEGHGVNDTPSESEKNNVENVNVIAKRKPLAFPSKGKSLPSTKADTTDTPLHKKEMASFDVPVLIRPETGVTVSISGIPLDLTYEVAERIASILKVYARPQ